MLIRYARQIELIMSNLLYPVQVKLLLFSFSFKKIVFADDQSEFMGKSCVLVDFKLSLKLSILLENVSEIDDESDRDQKPLLSKKIFKIPTHKLFAKH